MVVAKITDDGNTGGSAFDLSLPFLLSQARDGLNITDLQGYAGDYIPRLEEIDGLLAQADQSDDFGFVVPGKFAHTDKDFTFNRADLKVIRAAVDASLMGLHLARSWECDFDIGSLYSEDGELIAEKSAIVDALKACFVLKSDHEMSAARDEFADALENMLGAHDALEFVSVNGILDDEALLDDGYAEIEEVLTDLENSLAGDAVFSYVSPVVTLNLDDFFTNPPSADAIDTDPFVLEDDRIETVELFFSEAFAVALPGIDFDQRYITTFTALNKSFVQTVFNEFNPAMEREAVLRKKRRKGRHAVQLRKKPCRERLTASSPTNAWN